MENNEEDKNRLIQFRIWNTLYGEFLNGFDTVEAMSNYLSGYKRATANYVVQQCTGVADKKNNLIFEGDIVDVGGVKYEIVWNKKGYCRFEARSVEDSKRVLTFNQSSNEQYEVVGNTLEKF